MGFITHTEDQSVPLQGGKKKKKKTHSVQFHTGIPTATHKQRLACTHATTHNATSSYQAALRGAGSENWVKNSAALCYSKGCVLLLLH